MLTVAIDPGVQKCGVAWFDQNELLMWAGYVAHRELNVEDYRNCKLVIEMPRIYPGSGQQKGDLNDLLNLAAVVGYLECIGRHDAERVFPAQWKGQVPKKIMNARILKKLDPVERLRIENVGSKTHNVIDAVGIGLWYLGRL